MPQTKSAVQSSNTSKVNKSTPNTHTKKTKEHNLINDSVHSKTNNTNFIDTTKAIVTVTETETLPTTKTASFTMNKNTTQVDRLILPHKEDSGTESGEDFRLFAAGIREKLDGQDQNIIEEVISALNRLESNLREGKAVSVDENKRKALLALVGRLQAGLTSPEKLVELANAMADIDSDYPLNDMSAPETNKQRFAKRRNRNGRHTVGVSREELADARRYMEDMILMENISNCTTPNSSLNTITPPRFVHTGKPANSHVTASHFKLESTALTNNKRRPLSGDFSVTFESPEEVKNNNTIYDNRTSQNSSPDSILKSARFTAKRQMMKRANTIDLAKTKKYPQEQDTDSEIDDRGGGVAWGLKRGVEVSIKKKIRNVIPVFEPKTENDHKFLAFINKQPQKSGVCWNGTKSVSNWTNKFGNIKQTFEVGSATTTGKPPQIPGHIHQNTGKSYWSKPFTNFNSSSHNPAQKSEQEVIEKRRLEIEHLERKRIELEILDRQRLQREHLERERIKRELYKEHRKQMEQQELECFPKDHENMDRQRLLDEQSIKPSPINQFIHAPHSVFRPIDNNQHASSIYKPIPQIPYKKSNTWQPTQNIKKDHTSSQLLNANYSFSTPYLNSPSPNSTSPVGLPWLSKPTLNTDFRHKANMFEERSQNDSCNPTFLQRHNSLRTPKLLQKQMVNEYSKRPSLPNTVDPYMALHAPSELPNRSIVSLPPPTNVSFSYAKKNYKSVPCLSTALNSIPLYPPRSREDSLTNPSAVPLILTTSNPLYSPQISSNGYNDPNSPLGSVCASPGSYNMQQNDFTDDDLESVNMTEYRVKSKVMQQPQRQIATTTPTRHRNHMSDDESNHKNSKAAKSLLHTMQNLSGLRVKNIVQDKNEPNSKIAPCLSPDGRSYQAPIVEPIFPAVTNFENNRVPVYNMNSKNQKLTNHYQITSVATSALSHPQEIDTKLTEKVVSKDYVTNSSSYSSEPQIPYVVEYPSEESLNSFSKDSQPELFNEKIPSQRNRNLSENSNTSSSLSYYHSQPSPDTNWTSNPISAKKIDIINGEEVVKKVALDLKKNKQTIKPDIAPKPYVSAKSAKAKQNISNIQPEIIKSKRQSTSNIEDEKQNSIQKLKQEITSNKVVSRKTYSVDYEPFSAPFHNQQQTEFETKHKIEELRRKSLGNVLHFSQYDKTFGLTENHEDEKRHVYKSSAPPDTPDIVKSSLPKDDSMPILKKFGPPQRHHYIPNSYQSPLSSSNKNITPNIKCTEKRITKVTNSSIKHEIMKNSSKLRTKPTIKDHAGSPQPTDEYIPRNIVFNNISAFSSLSRFKQEDINNTAIDEHDMPRINRLSKCDSWNQILQQQQNQQQSSLGSSPKFGTNELRRTKSGHSLSIPKMYEAGIDKDEISEKQKTVAAYFSGNKSPNSQLQPQEVVSKTKYEQYGKKSTINRTKTSEKVSASRKSFTSINQSSTVSSTNSGLSRSATMPHIANINLLDESNVEDAFEQLMSGS